jgi:hypothetical protein
MTTTGKRRRAASLLTWAALVAVLSTTAYVGGEVLARRWMTPSLALPGETPSPQPQLTPATPVGPDEPVEGILGTEAVDEWSFRGQVGQSATIEMWFHPGSGSSVEAELVVRLITPSGEALAEKAGSVFLPPYLFEPSLPATGLYRLQVLPLSGAPGRYSLRLALSEGLAQPTTGAPSANSTASPLEGSSAAVSAQFQWPTTRRSISGWTFHDPSNPGHIGLDIAAEAWDRIVAAADGEVTFAEWGGGYGNLVILKHDRGWSSYYAHLIEIAVEEGQEVRQGETLGGAGSTGYSTGPHLHFELRFQGRPVDPHVHLP